MQEKRKSKGLGGLFKNKKIMTLYNLEEILINGKPTLVWAKKLSEQKI